MRSRRNERARGADAHRARAHDAEGESLLLILGIPLLLLGFFSSVDVLPKGDFRDSVDFLTPGVLALAVMSTGMVQLAIGTSFERQYGVLKRLGRDTPWPAAATHGENAFDHRR